MRCIIIEDQPPAQRILRKYIEDMGSLRLAGVFPDAVQALHFLQTEQVDLIFLDIHLPKMSGLDFLKALQHPPPVILTTAFPDFALESYEFNVVDYLLKPFSFQRFVKAVSKAPATGQAGSAGEPLQEIFIKSGYEHIRIRIDDIQYLKSDADYTEIFLSGKKRLSSEPLRYWLETLDARQFARIHKSYIVNTSKVEKISGNQVYLAEGEALPIGRAYKEAFLEEYVRFRG